MSKDKIIGVYISADKAGPEVVVDGWDESISLARGASGPPAWGFRGVTHSSTQEK